jgi:hypothetical protein
MRKPKEDGQQTITVRPESKTWKQIFILAKQDQRSLPKELIALAELEFKKRFPKGLTDYLELHPDTFKGVFDESVTNQD